MACPCCVGKIAGDKPETGAEGRGARSTMFRERLGLLVKEAKEAFGEGGGWGEDWDP